VRGRATNGVLLLLGAALAAACSAPPPPRLVVIRAGRLLDGSGAPAQQGVRITIDAGAISELARDDGGPLATDATREVIDARADTVMPGLVDVGAQLEAPDCGQPSLGDHVHGLFAHLASGVTSVAGLRASARLAAGLRSYVGTARHRGPRLFVAGAVTVGGELNEEAQMHDAVRELAERGVDYTVIAAEADAGRNVARLSRLVCATVEETHTQDMLAELALRQGQGGLAEAALSCGADAVMTAPDEPLAAELVAALAAKGATLVPAAPGAGVGRARGTGDDLAAAAAAGLPIAMASGALFCAARPQSLVGALQGLTHAGLTPLAALQAATSGGARVLGLGDALGRVAVGYRADLIAVRGRPDENLLDLERLDWVLVDGVRQETMAAGWFATAAAALHVAWNWFGQ
jgi:imidazolonepropionase-like amidohydrolase